MTIAELIAELEAATGPSLVLDGEVWCAVNGYEFVQWDGAGCVYKNPAAPSWDRGIKHVQAREVRPFTASLDAAVALVERVLPDHRWLIDKRPLAKNRSDGYRATCYRQGHPYKSDGSDTPSAWAATPALALLTALLRAKQGGGDG